MPILFYILTRCTVLCACACGAVLRTRQGDPFHTVVLLTLRFLSCPTQPLCRHRPVGPGLCHPMEREYHTRNCGYQTFIPHCLDYSKEWSVVSPPTLPGPMQFCTPSISWLVTTCPGLLSDSGFSSRTSTVFPSTKKVFWEKARKA